LVRFVERDPEVFHEQRRQTEGPARPEARGIMVSNKAVEHTRKSRESRRTS